MCARTFSHLVEKCEIKRHEDDLYEVERGTNSNVNL